MTGKASERVDKEPLRRLLEEVRNRTPPRFVRAAGARARTEEGRFDIEGFLIYVGMSKSQYKYVKKDEPGMIDINLADRIYSNLGLTHRFLEDYPFVGPEGDNEGEELGCEAV